MHDLYAEFNSAYKSCMFCPREVDSEAVSGNFPIYLGLGVYGHGTCLHSLHEATCWPFVTLPSGLAPRFQGAPMWPSEEALGLPSSTRVAYVVPWI